MRLLLVRHGETVDNVAGKYAGTTDSALTNHGVLQANRLGAHLCKTFKVSHIFSSDLQRAVKTAEAIQLAQDQNSTVPGVTRLEVLREQDFGFYEGKPFYERPRDLNKSGNEAQHIDLHRNEPGFKDVESKESMKARMDAFIDTHLFHLFHSTESGDTVVVVAHGIILSHLWRGVLRRFAEHNVSIETGVVSLDKMFSLEHLGVWANTGFLDLEIKPKPIKEETTSSTSVAEPVDGPAKDPSVNKPLVETSPPINPAVTRTAVTTVGLASTADTLVALQWAPPSSKALDMSLVVKAVNNLEHLKGLKKTRGGIGSLKHDSKQKTMDSFFTKKRKFEP